MTWNDRIHFARVRGHFTAIRGTFTAKDKSAAGLWVTCACGEQDARIERHAPKCGPKDKELWRLGRKFQDDVTMDKVEIAAITLSKIEQRSAQILLELNKTHPQPGSTAECQSSKV